MRRTSSIDGTVSSTTPIGLPVRRSRRSVPLLATPAAALLALATGCLHVPAPVDSVKSDTELPALVCFTNARDWRVEADSPDQITLLSPRIETHADWNELIVCWNVQPAAGAGLVVQAQGLHESGETRFYGLGHWSLGDPAPVIRTSLREPTDADGSVHTDTLALRQPARAARLRLTLVGQLAHHPERLRLVGLSFCDTRQLPRSRPPQPEAWGRTLDVPERSQVSYADGRAWCSPTSVSMMLGWWSQAAHRPDLDRLVPEVAEGVNDPGWPGTGNWPFNTAYAGSLDGMTACAARLHDLREVEELIVAGIPVVLSVNAPVLRGKPPAKDGGHLILCVGFTSGGDIVANDPWARLEEGQRVRRTYPRENVERAWQHAHQLAYLIAPTSYRASFPCEWH